MRYNEQFKVGIMQSNNDLARPAVLDEFMQELAGNHFSALGYDDNKMHFEDHKAFIISRMTVELYRTVPVAAELDAYTWISAGKAANFPRNYEIQYEGEVAARGLSSWALVDTENKKLIRVKDFPFGVGSEEEKAVLGIPEKFRTPKDVEYTKAFDMSIQYWQTDINRHMNNVRYVDPLWSAIPDIAKRETRAFSIYYQHETVEGECATIKVSRAYPCDIEVDTEQEGLINNNYSAETDEIFYVCLEVDGEVRTQSMWVVSKVQ